MRPYKFISKVVCCFVLISFLTSTVAWTEPVRRVSVEREKGSRFALAPEQMTKKESPKRIQALIAQREALNEIFNSAYATVAKDLADGKKTVEQINADIQKEIAAKIDAYSKTPGKKISYTVLTDRIGAVLSQKDPKKLDHMIVPFKMGQQYYAFIVRNKTAAADNKAQTVIEKLPQVMDYSQPDKDIAVEIRSVPVTDRQFESWLNDEIAKIEADPTVPNEVKKSRGMILRYLLPSIFMIAMIFGLQGCLLDHHNEQPIVVEQTSSAVDYTKTAAEITPEVSAMLSEALQKAVDKVAIPPGTVVLPDSKYVLYKGIYVFLANNGQPVKWPARSDYAWACIYDSNTKEVRTVELGKLPALTYYFPIAVTKDGKVIMRWRSAMAKDTNQFYGKYAFVDLLNPAATITTMEGSYVYDAGKEALVAVPPPAADVPKLETALDELIPAFDYSRRIVSYHERGDKVLLTVSNSSYPRPTNRFYVYNKTTNALIFEAGYDISPQTPEIRAVSLDGNRVFIFMPYVPYPNGGYRLFDMNENKFVASGAIDDPVKFDVTSGEMVPKTADEMQFAAGASLVPATELPQAVKDGIAAGLRTPVSISGNAVKSGNKYLVIGYTDLWTRGAVWIYNADTNTVLPFSAIDPAGKPIQFRGDTRGSSVEIRGLEDNKIWIDTAIGSGSEKLFPHTQVDLLTDRVTSQLETVSPAALPGLPMRLGIAGRPELIPETLKGMPVSTDEELAVKMKAVNGEVENMLTTEAIKTFIKPEKLPAGVTVEKLVEDLKAALKAVQDEFYAGFNVGSRLIAHADPARGVIELGEGMVRKSDPKTVARVKIHELLHHVLGDANHDIIRGEEGLRDKLLTDKMTVSDEAEGVQKALAEVGPRKAIADVADALDLQQKEKKEERPAIIYVTVEPENNLIGLEETVKKLQEKNRQVKIILVGREEYPWTADLRKKLMAADTYGNIVVEFIAKKAFDDEIKAGKNIDDIAVAFAQKTMDQKDIKMKVKVSDIGWIGSVEDAYQVASGFKKIPVIKPREKGANQLYDIGMEIDVMELVIMAARISGEDLGKVSFAKLLSCLDAKMQAELLGALEALGIKADENVAQALMKMPPTTTVSGKIATDLNSLRSALIAA